ncbi:hypothetical protein ACWU37_05255 [Photobacterium damselae subsp. damselae]|uniref:hypothetical protein n=1 Tax=Photobacterium damselae TaxID=38293 RepID=UPI001302E02F|nr:hypothetical protein [Photobacterium damselae]
MQISSRLPQIDVLSSATKKISGKPAAIAHTSAPSSSSRSSSLALSHHLSSVQQAYQPVQYDQISPKVGSALNHYQQVLHYGAKEQLSQLIGVDILV